MKVIKNKYIPFGSYDAMTLWPFVFTKGEVSKQTLNHERIHLEQQKELLVVGFYVLYVVSFAWRFLWIAFKDWDKSFGECWDYAYRRNPFEREAYDHEWDGSYLQNRPRFAWIDKTNNKDERTV